MTKLSKVNLEHIFYATAFMISIGIRLYQLGYPPLSDSEAALALQSLSVARFAAISVTIQPLYVAWTGLLFFLFDSSNFIARIIPAISGCILPLLPYFFRRYIGRSTAIILAFFLSLNPIIIAAARAADGPTFGLLFTLLAVICLINRRVIGTGICTAMLIMGGSSVWQGLLGIGIALLIEKLLFHNEQVLASSPKFSGWNGENWNWKYFAIALAVALLSAGTLFFRVPTAISAIPGSLIDFFKGWAFSSSGHTILQVSLSFLAYEIFFILLAIWGIVHYFINREKQDRFWMIWLSVSLIIALIYPGHQSLDLVWPTIPLLLLAARQMHRLLSAPTEDWLSSIGQSILIFILLVFSIYNLMGIFNPTATIEDPRLRWIGFGGALVLLLLVTALVGWGWSTKIATNGLIWGVGLFFALISLSSTWQATSIGRRPDTELWRTTPYGQELDLLQQTLSDVSEWNTGEKNLIDIVVVEDKSPSLEWVLRKFHTVSYISNLSPDARPSIIITKEDQSPSISAQYSGQDFTLKQSPNWTLLSFNEWMRWFFYRDTMTEKQSAIVWVRTDLFPAAKIPQAAQ